MFKKVALVSLATVIFAAGIFTAFLTYDSRAESAAYPEVRPTMTPLPTPDPNSPTPTPFPTPTIPPTPSPTMAP